MTHRSRILVVTTVLWLAVSSVAGHEFATECERITELLHIEPGHAVADVGAGSGRFGEELANRVGPAGRVYVTEIDEDSLEELHERVERSGAGNMTVVVGETDDPALPVECCDALLLRYVVHHMANADAMFAGIGRALRAGGRLLVIEKTEPGDGIEPAELIETARTAGFEVISRHDEWGAHDGHYAVLLRVARSPR